MPPYPKGYKAPDFNLYDWKRHANEYISRFIKSLGAFSKNHDLREFSEYLIAKIRGLKEALLTGKI